MGFRRFAPVVLCSLLVSVGLAIPTAATAGLDDRDSEPLVLTGTDLPLLLGSDPRDVVAFSWFGSWRQVPVQVDERKMIDYRPVRQLPFNNGNEFREMAYADPDTWAEADGVPQTVTNPGDRGSGAVISGTTGDPTVDENDEIAMMTEDAGGSAAGKPAPGGVVAGTRTPVKITDPLDPDSSRFIYLFRTDSGLNPDAGTDYVSYRQIYSPGLLGGYRDGYNYSSIGDNVNGPPVNPEDSRVKTSRYEIGIPGRWMIDRLVIAAGEGEADILDGDKSTVSPTGCGRNELTFSRGGGGFIANIDGPVRAIRSFIGANSGTFTQREYIFYEGMFENRTFLRVHPGINQFVTAMDLSPDAIGMTYRNQLNPDGVTIDGIPDAPVAGPFDWEQFSGAMGSVTNVARYESDIEGLVRSSYYQDDATPPSNSSMLCSGDDHSYGAAGPMLSTSQNNTDPTLVDTFPDLPLSHFQSVRYSWFDGPEADAGLAALRSGQVDHPIRFETGAATDPAPEPGKAALKVTAKPNRIRIAAGGKRRIRIKVRNVGDEAATRVLVCLVRKRWLGTRNRCGRLPRIDPGKSAGRFFPVRVRGHFRPGKRTLLVKASARKTGTSNTRAAVIIRRK